MGYMYDLKAAEDAVKDFNLFIETREKELGYKTGLSVVSMEDGRFELRVGSDMAVVSRNPSTAFGMLHAFFIGIESAQHLKIKTPTGTLKAEVTDGESFQCIDTRYIPDDPGKDMVYASCLEENGESEDLRLFVYANESDEPTDIIHYDISPAKPA